jgi:hypothetical protein
MSKVFYFQIDRLDKLNIYLEYKGTEEGIW